MEKSDPQLRDDVRRLSAQVRALQEELAAERAKPARVQIEKQRVVSEVVRDNPAQAKEIAKLKATIAKLQSRPADVVEKVVKVDRPTPDPAQAKEIAKLKATIAKLQSRPADVVEKIVDRVVEVPVPVEKVVRVPEYRDDPKTLAALGKAKATISKLQAQPEKVQTKIVEKPVDRPTPDPKQAKEIERLKAQIDAMQSRAPDVIEKIVRVPMPDPAHAAEIAGLRAEIDILKRGGLQ